MPQSGLFDPLFRLQSDATTNASRLLRGILENCSDCIKILDLRGRLEYMSEAGQRGLEITSVSDVIGQDWLLPWVDHYRDLAAAALDEARAGRSSRFEGIHPTRLGGRNGGT